MSNPSGIPRFAHFTRANFNSLVTKDPSTFYVVVEISGIKKLYLGGKLLTENYLELDGSNYMTGPLRLSQTTQIEYDSVSESIKFVFL